MPLAEADVVTGTDANNDLPNRSEWPEHLVTSDVHPDNLSFGPFIQNGIRAQVDDMSAIGQQKATGNAEELALEEWMDKELRTIRRLARGHYLAGKRAATTERWLSWLTIGLTAITGTAIFASLSEENAPYGVKLAAGLIAALATTLAGVRAAGKYPEKAQKHKTAGARFDDLEADLLREEFRTHYPDVGEDELVVETIHQARAKLSEQMPDLRDKFYDEARKQVGGKQSQTSSG